MNPFQELVAETIVNDMARSQSFDLSNYGSSHTQITSVSSIIRYDPARLANFLGYHTLNNKTTQKLETIYENLPTSKQNFSPQISSNVCTNQTNEQKSSDKNNLSIRGSASSWNL